MAIEPFDIPQNRERALRALDEARERNTDKSVPIRVNRHTVVFVTPKQAKDKAYIEKLVGKLNAPTINW